MKKFAIVSAMICLLLLSSQAVYADAVFESGNSFFERNKGQMVSQSRKVFANSEAGSVQLKRTPSAIGSVGELENGERSYVMSTCLYQGDYWGLVSNPYGGYDWARMDELLVVYDGVAFREECGEEFYPWEGEPGNIEAADALILWEWPGSGEIYHEDDFYSGQGLWGLVFEYAYLDEQGMEWGFIERYGQGFNNLWVCISDPSNRDLPALKPATDPAPWTPKTPHVEIGGGGGAPVIIVIIVAAVVVCTLLLLRRFYKPAKKA